MLYEIFITEMSPRPQWIKSLTPSQSFQKILTEYASHFASGCADVLFGAQVLT